MRNAIYVLLLLISLPISAADSIPRCWRADQPSEDIQDGLFRIHLKTAGTSALDVATVLGVVSQSLAAQNGVAPSTDLSEIEIDAQSADKYWQPSALFPTLESYKTGVVSSLSGVLRFNATVECAKVNRHGH